MDHSPATGVGGTGRVRMSVPVQHSCTETLMIISSRNSPTWVGLAQPIKDPNTTETIFARHSLPIQSARLSTLHFLSQQVECHHQANRVNSPGPRGVQMLAETLFGALLGGSRATPAPSARRSHHPHPFANEFICHHVT